MAKKAKQNPSATGEQFLSVLVGAKLVQVRRSDAADATSATWARRYRLYEAPDLIKKLLDERAAARREPPEDALFEAYSLLGERSEARGKLFKNPCFVTAEIRGEFYRVMRTDVWSSLKAMQATVVNWHEAWLAKGNSAAALVSRLGDKEVVPGALDAPSLLGVGDAARAVSAAFLKALTHGTGVARTDAAEAQRIKDLLTSPVILAATGKDSTIDLVKALGLAVEEREENAERDLVSFVFASLDAASGTDADKVYDLKCIGERIPWDKIQGG